MAVKNETDLLKTRNTGAVEEKLAAVEEETAKNNATGFHAMDFDAKKVLSSVTNEISKDAKKAGKEIDKFDKQLEGKTVQELRNLYDDALVQESEAKRALVLLRDRASKMASTAGIEAEEEIIRAKLEWAKIVEYLKAVEIRLRDEYLDIYGTKR